MRARLYWLVLLSAFFACSASEEAPAPAPDAGAGGAPPADLRPAFTKLCTAFAQRFCERAAACPTAQSYCVQGSPDYVQSCTPELSGAASAWDDCASTVADVCMDRFFGPGSSLDTVELATACLGAYDFASCDALFGGPPPAACPRGKLAEGTTCYADLQCAGGRCSRSTFLADRPYCGLCAAPADLGSPCHEPSDCAANLVCVPIDPTSQKPNVPVCGVAGAEGDACSFGQGKGCANGLACANGHCLRISAKAGEPCSHGLCAPEAAAACDPGTNKCVAFVPANVGQACDLPGLTAAKPGAPLRVCAYPAACLSQQCATPSCVKYACVAPIPDGAACTGAMCATGRSCPGLPGIAQPPKPGPAPNGKCERIHAADCMERAP